MRIGLVTKPRFLASAVASGGVANPYTGSGATIAARGFEILDGSDAVPVATSGPTARIARVENLGATTGGGSNLTNEKNAALTLLTTGHGSGAAGSEMQAVALFAYANVDGAGTWDAVAINAIGRAQGSSTQRGTAAYLEGRKDVAGARVVGTEIRANNNTPSNQAGDGTYLASGASNVVGLWVTSAANALANPKLGAGIQVGSADAVGFFGVGVGVVSAVDADFRSDSTATTAVALNGTHTNAVLAAASAGISGFGTVAPQTGRVHIDAISTLTPTAVPTNHALFVSDFQGIAADRGGTIGIGGWTDTGQTVARAFGVIAGKKSNLTSSDTTGYLALGANLTAVGYKEYVRIDGSAGVTLVKVATDKLGFWGATPVVRPTVTGAKGSNLALGSLLTALAAMGIVVDSSTA